MTCDDCGKNASIKGCETHKPAGARICKDCCIVKMKGHTCKWFDLCWA